MVIFGPPVRRASLVYYVFYLKYAIFITLSCAACQSPVYAQQIQLLIPVVTVIISSFFFNFNKPLINCICVCVCMRLEDHCAHVTSSFGNFYHVHYCSLMPLTLIMCTRLRVYKGDILTNGTWMTDFTWLSVYVPIVDLIQDFSWVFVNYSWNWEWFHVWFFFL